MHNPSIYSRLSVTSPKCQNTSPYKSLHMTIHVKRHNFWSNMSLEEQNKQDMNTSFRNKAKSQSKAHGK